MGHIFKAGLALGALFAGVWFGKDVAINLLARATTATAASTTTTA